jgi:hypothetical protein
MCVETIMALTNINKCPRFTKHLVSLKAFDSKRLSVVDVGARGGFESHNGKIDQAYVEGGMAADVGLVRGRTVWSREVQANIIGDAIKLLKRIKLLES